MYGHLKQTVSEKGGLRAGPCLGFICKDMCKKRFQKKGGLRAGPCLGFICKGNYVKKKKKTVSEKGALRVGL